MSTDRHSVTSEPRLICSLTGADRPSFSPDGSQVAFHVQNASQTSYSIWIVGADGSDPHLVYPPAGTQNPNASRPDWSWSPTIAFGNGGEIWTINPDGTGAAPYVDSAVTPPAGVSMTYPSWHKDLAAITAVGYVGPDLAQAMLYTLTPDAITQLTTSPHPCAGRPSVNPRGDRIAFAGNDRECSQSENQIWVVEPPGKPRRLEPGSITQYQGRSPNWSPKGDLIVFESTRPSPDPSRATLYLWVIGSDGCGARALGLQGYHAEWNRQQTQIVYATGQGLWIVDYHG